MTIQTSMTLYTAAVAELVTATTEVANNVAQAREHFTPEGYADFWAKSVKGAGLIDRLNVLKEHREKITQRVEAMKEETLAAAFPVAANATERMAAEMEANRIMARSSFDATSPVGKYDLAAMEPSPARRIVMEEMVAAGQKQSDLYSAVMDREGLDVMQLEYMVKVILNNTVNRVLESLEHALLEPLDARAVTLEMPVTVVDLADVPNIGRVSPNDVIIPGVPEVSSWRKPAAAHRAAGRWQ